ncbi:phosphoenolpyruvate--protein phosphotransferase PtsP [Vibrio sp. MACH09]|uniref:phosphoenolpyruvate--protein phosphotransferase n=1 Tax=Vibrio sp. MACH09 TaxID=3025122 RepID=UPI002792BFCD|nr:phosphoenolpyruvate--protein phosphotransferase [Vibrio sp. MACH09]GLO61800.1 phosphoenolpyruvate--protein phosphotransferase PtsP [Vibrio sp. MACH09]
MLTQLRDIVEKVSKLDDVHQALKLLVQETCKAVQTECCTVYLANDEKNRLELMATQGLKVKKRHFFVKYQDGLVGLVRRNAEPLNLAEAAKHPEFKLFPQLGEEIYNSFLGTPIIYRKQVLGVLVIQQQSPRLFNEMEESFLVTLAAQIAVIIAHAQGQGQWLLNKKRTEIITGIGASPGVAVGEFWWDNTQPELSDVYPASALDVSQEQEWLMLAIENAIADFRRMRKKLDSELNKDALAIFDLFTHLLNDPMLRADLKDQINKGDRADWALRQVVEAYSNRFAKMSDVYMRERAQDIRELGQRLLYFLHNSEVSTLELQQPVILVVRELTASLLAGIPKEKLLAVVSLEGAANSHAAILSRALGVPAIMGATFTPESIQGKRGIVNGYSGEIVVEPNKTLLKEYISLQQEEHELSELVEGEISQAACTKDNCQVEVLLNAGLSADANIAINKGVDGVGLYRTEISFLLQHGFPSEEEQASRYRSILSSYPDKKVVMRTLDIGGDKPLPYLPIEEDNPFLGWRGIRFTLDHPDIFLVQLRAMLKASVGIDNLRILLPMIASCQELDDALLLLNQAYIEVKKIEPKVVRPEVGIMVEVPSMLYLLPLLANKVDYVSVGSNDLTQYLLAVDRNNARVASIYESIHPAVIMALKQIQQTCQQYRLPVSVCGELAGDPIGALLLVGLGYRSLSMNTANVARVKYLLRKVDSKQLETLTAKALGQPYSSEIYKMMVEYLESKQLAGFVRAGKK